MSAKVNPLAGKIADPSKLTRDWIVAPGMALRTGVLAFSPDARAWSYHVKMVPLTGADVVDVPAGDAMQATTQTLLLLQTIIKP